MQRTSRRFWLGWLACFGLGLVWTVSGRALEPGPADPMARPPEGATPPVGAAPPVAATITIVGKVEVTAATVAEGRMVQLVATEGKRKLIVDEIGAGRAMAKHVGERVSATGVLSQRKDGREVLLVSSFRPLGS